MLVVFELVGGLALPALEVDSRDAFDAFLAEVASEGCDPSRYVLEEVDDDEVDDDFWDSV